MFNSTAYCTFKEFDITFIVVNNIYRETML